MAQAFIDKRTTARMAFLGIATAGWLPFVQAQEAARAGADESQLETVTVTARKREESSQDTPLSISVISAENIQKKGITSLADVAAQTPGLQFDRGLSENDVRPVIRGITSLFGRPSVAILTDGIDTSGSAIVSNGGGGLMNLRLLDIDRIEVIRGPQSALYGRNAFAGAINYVTKAPTSNFQAGAGVDVGNYGLYDVNGFLSGPLLGDTLKGRVNVEGHGLNGFYDNQLTGNRTGKESGGGIRGQLLYTPTDQLEVLLRAEYSRSNQAQGAAVLDTANSVTPSGFRYFNGYVNADPANVKYIGDPTGLESDTYRGSLDARYDLGSATLSSTTSYVNWDAKQNDDVGYSFLPALNSGLSVRQLWNAGFRTRQWSQDFRLTSNGETRLKYMVGLYGFHEFSNATDSTESYYASCLNPLRNLRPGIRCANPDGTPNGPFVNTPDGLEERQTTHFSTYGSLNFAATDRLNIGGELRLGKDRIAATHTPFTRSFAVLGFASFTGGPFTAANFLPTGGYRLPPNESAVVTSTSINPRVSVDYKLMRDTMAYASFAKGTKPGGVSQILGTERYEVNKYAPEKLYAYEVGLKSELLDRHLTTNVAAFYSHYKNQQTPYSALVANQTGTFTAVTGVTNAGSVNTHGIELMTRFRVNSHLDGGFNWAWTVSKYDEFKSIDAAARALLNGDLAGTDVPAVPRNSGNLQLRWQGRLWTGHSYFVQGTETYVGQRHANNDAAGTIKLPQYFQTDAQAGVEDKAWTVTAYVKNLFKDKTPRSALRYVNIASASASDQAVIVYLADPMQFGIRAAYRF